MRSYLESLGANRIVLALSAARMADSLGNSILFVVIPLYVIHLPSRWLHLPETVLVGVLLAVYGLVNSACQPIVGHLVDRLGRRKELIQLGLAIMAVATLALVWAQQYVHLLLIRMLQGIGVALTIPASLAVMARGTRRETRGGAMGIFTTMRLVGFTIGPVLGGYLHDRFGFDVVFYTGAGLIAAGFVLVQLLVVDPGGRGETEQPRRQPGFFSREVLTPGFLGLGFATFVMATAFTLMVPLEKQFNTRLDQGAFGFGLAFSALMVSRLLLQIPLGRLSDRIGRRPLLLGGLVLMAPATALLGLAGSTLSLAGIRVLQGAASAGVAAPAFALAADLGTGPAQGRQMSVVSMGFGFGIALGPLLAGALAVRLFELPFLVGGVLSLVGALVVYRWVPESTG